ncbi:MAG TPA: DUF1707 domain-containing protein [Acidimicrobiales bacterium]|jgi:hypothetical protein|nr:DUF1707 domain-containing protein [Acidimicrobiales bacterium]
MEPLPDPSPGPPSPLRASDQDRDRTVAALHDAAVAGRLPGEEHDRRVDRALIAATVGELQPLLDDLPVTRDQLGLPIETTVARVDGRFGKVVRQVDPGTDSHVHAVARFGQVVLDLRSVAPESPPLLITADSFAGQVKILLPPGARVVDSGTARFGNRKASGHSRGPGTGPLIYLTGLTRFGQVKCIAAAEPGFGGRSTLGR